MMAYQNGDAAAFELLYRRHKDGLFSFLFRHYPRAAIVEELAQDTWMAVIDATHRYQATARFRTWLYQIAHNKLVDHWRRQDNRHSALDTATEPASVEAADNIEQQQNVAALMAALSSLPHEQKNALLLQEQGFSHADIAEITGVGMETIKSRLRYARKQLREKLGGET